MPSKSKKQQDFMAAVANNPKFAKKAGVPQSVGKDYEEADNMKKTKKYQAGGMSMKDMAVSKMIREQGDNDRLDESMGARNGPTMQGMKARRDESKGMERSSGSTPYSGDKAMKFQRGGPMPAGMANRRAGVSGVATPPTGPFPEPKKMPTRLGDGQPTDTMDMRPRQARSSARRGGGGRKAGGQIGAYKAGGKVRGSGCATKGVRAAKMVSMKGA